MSNEDRTFKIKLNTSKSKPIKVQLNKTSSDLDVRMDTNTPAEETYFDDIIIYTGYYPEEVSEKIRQLSMHNYLSYCPP